MPKCDEFTRGISSHQIRLRLLECHTLSLDETIEKTCALESANTSNSPSEININTTYVFIEDSLKESTILSVSPNSQKHYFCDLSSHVNLEFFYKKIIRFSPSVFK